MVRPPPRSTPVPYPALFRSLLGDLEPLHGSFAVDGRIATVPQGDHARLDFPVSARDVALMGAYARTPWWRRIARADRKAAGEDRKSTRLNSSHANISYAVFC